MIKLDHFKIYSKGDKVILSGQDYKICEFIFSEKQKNNRKLQISCQR